MTLLIKNVKIVGGSREFLENSDVFVSDDKISAIGNFPHKDADEVVDGQGAYLSPGFIDVNTDSDHYLTLFDNPAQADFLKQGVTTIFGGMCGSSLAPLIYGSLESVRKWGGSEDKINVDWHSMAEFLSALDKHPLAVNFGTMIGHSTIRRAIVGDGIRDLTKNELSVFMETLRAALADGGFGLSTGLAYVHARKTPYTELRQLAETIKKANGVYATHLRDQGQGIVQSVEETMKISKESGARTLISHFVPLREAKKQYETALGIIDSMPNELDLHFDIYPFEALLLPIYTFLPVWAQNGGIDTMFKNVADPWLSEKIKTEMKVPEEKDFIVGQAPGNDVLVGKTLHDIKDMYGLPDAASAMIQLMRATHLRATIVHNALDASLIRRAITNKRSFIASNAPSFGERGSSKHLQFERMTSTFTRFLSLVEKEHLMPLKDAIRKITLEPARVFGLTGRGEIKEGNIADLACFRNGEILFTIVGGKVVLKNKVFQDKFPGKTLRHHV